MDSAIPTQDKFDPSVSVSSTPPSSKKIVPLIIIALVILVIISIVVMLQGAKKNGSENTMTPNVTTSPTQAAGTSAQLKNFPEVKVSNWTVSSDISVAAPSSANVFAFKQNLDKTDFTKLGNNLFPVTDIKDNSTRLTASSTTTGATVLYLLKETGSFVYISDGGANLPASGAAGVASFTQSLFGDKSIQMAAEYDNTNKPGVRYYELHRSKATLGLPVLNLFGLLNLPAATKLSSVDLANPSDNATSAQIVNTTDNSNGKARANSFDTVTVGVKDGKVVSIASNLRPFASLGTPSKVISFADAVTKLKQNDYAYIYTSPVDAAATDSEKVYPGGKANLISATVDDATIAYLEDLPTGPQSKLVPYYIFKGTGQLTSGYKVRFTAAVPAVTSGVLGASTTNTGLLAQNSTTGVPVGDNTTQQQGTLRFAGTAAKSAATQAASVVPTQCGTYPNPQDLHNVQKDPVTGIIFGQGLKDQGYQWTDTDPKLGAIQWYVITQGGWDVNKMMEAIDAIERITKADAGEDAAAKARRLTRDLDEFNTKAAGCPVRVTGPTPSLFIHSDVLRTLNVWPSNVTYSLPAIAANGWSAVVRGDEIKVNGLSTDYLYYEYAPVTFTKPSEGWVVNRSEMTQFVSETATDLSLNKVEAERLGYELNNAVANLHTSADKLFVGLISPVELNSKAPLKVSANDMNVQRIHFYVGVSKGENVAEPELQPVHRSSSYILEIGAVAQ